MNLRIQFYKMALEKIKISDILKTQKYAIKATSAAQVKKLIPFYKNMEDIEMFFEKDKKHVEYIGSRHTMNRKFHLFFVNKDNKVLIDYEQLEFD